MENKYIGWLKDKILKKNNSIPEDGSSSSSGMETMSEYFRKELRRSWMRKKFQHAFASRKKEQLNSDRVEQARKQAEELKKDKTKNKERESTYAYHLANSKNIDQTVPNSSKLVEQNKKNRTKV